MADHAQRGLVLDLLDLWHLFRWDLLGPEEIDLVRGSGGDYSREPRPPADEDAVRSRAQAVRDRRSAATVFRSRVASDRRWERWKARLREQGVPVVEVMVDALQPGHPTVLRVRLTRETLAWALARAAELWVDSV